MEGEKLPLDKKEYAEKLPLDREVIKRVEFPKFWTYELMQQYAQGIPRYPENDPDLPEWRRTPVVLFGSKDTGGRGEIFVKNEADPQSNPTKTIKDRPAWELATIYRDLARLYEGKIRDGTLSKAELESMALPRFSLITAGNEGRAVAERFARHNLPPPKLILDKDTLESRIKKLKPLRADIYLVPLGVKLTHEDILRFTDNEGGVEVTSEEIRKWVKFEPSAIFYDWHVHEAFNENPDEIYIPYGSGRLMENYLVWQTRTATSYGGGERDSRLKIDPKKVSEINIFGVEPERSDSRADKLTAKFRPFVILTDEYIAEKVKSRLTGRETGKYKVREQYIDEAYSLYKSRGIEAEPSGAASLAYYLQRYDQGKVKEWRKILVVNSGAGLYEYDEE